MFAMTAQSNTLLEVLCTCTIDFKVSVMLQTVGLIIREKSHHTLCPEERCATIDRLKVRRAC